MCGVKIILGYKFERSVHAHYRHAEIDGVDVLLRDVFCNGSAAARINLAELCGLPEYAVLCKERTDVSDIFCGRIIGGVLSAGSGVLDRKSVV
mgnify:CR=1 FL=1